MTTLLRVAFFCIVFGAAAARPNEHNTKIEHRDIVTQVKPNNGMLGVASVAGITSRNGRLSTLTGVKLIPQMDSVAVSSDGAPFFYPLTVTKESDGKYASGSIQIYPGSVMVSSTAKSGYGTELKPWPKIDVPSVSDIFMPPLELFNAPRSVEPWFTKDIFKPILPPQVNFESTWPYPHFNPFFSFWR